MQTLTLYRCLLADRVACGNRDHSSLDCAAENISMAVLKMETEAERRSLDLLDIKHLGVIKRMSWAKGETLYCWTFDLDKRGFRGVHRYLAPNLLRAAQMLREDLDNALAGGSRDEGVWMGDVVAVQRGFLCLMAGE